MGSDDTVRLANKLAAMLYVTRQFYDTLSPKALITHLEEMNELADDLAKSVFDMSQEDHSRTN